METWKKIQTQNIVVYVIRLNEGGHWGLVSNGNRTEWSAIQGAITQVLSKLVEREAPG